MKILKNSNKIVIIASDRGGNCPRSILTPISVKMGDDYHGKLKFGKKLLVKVMGV